MILWIYEECRSNRRPIWITMQSIYKGILMVRDCSFFICLFFVTMQISLHSNLPNGY